MNSTKEFKRFKIAGWISSCSTPPSTGDSGVGKSVDTTLSSCASLSVPPTFQEMLDDGNDDIFLSAEDPTNWENKKMVHVKLVKEMRAHLEREVGSSQQIIQSQQHRIQNICKELCEERKRLAANRAQHNEAITLLAQLPHCSD